MNHSFSEIKKNFGFGCMRFPKTGDQVDIPAVQEMVDTFLAAGFNYFDTARPYHNTQSEHILRQVLTSRYPRESYVLTNKLSPTFFEKEEDVPRSAITMGMGAIMSAKKVVLVANGKKKEEILKKAFFGPITPLVPASILQLHPDVTVIFSEN